MCLNYVSVKSGTAHCDTKPKRLGPLLVIFTFPFRKISKNSISGAYEIY